MDQVTNIIRQRRSIRKYKPDAILQEHIDLMLEAAMMAPSAGNSRPWEFVIISDEDTRLKITEVSPYARAVAGAPLAIVVCGRPDLQSGKLDGFWPQDCGAAIQNILLQAAALGYGTVWCGLHPMADRVEAVRRLLDVTSLPMAVIAVGVPDESPDARGFYDKTRVKYI